MKKTILFLSALFSILLSFSQNYKTLYLPLSVVIEDSTMVSNAFVKVNLDIYSEKISIRDYSGNDENLIVLSKSISALTDLKFNDFKNLSDKADTSIQDAYDFYSYFVPHSEKPMVFGLLDLGEFKIYFVELSEDFQLMTFCLRNSSKTPLNYPSVMENPAVIAVIDAVNHVYALPDEFIPVSSAPINGHQKITVDSILGMKISLLEFYFLLDEIKFSTGDLNDTANIYNAKYKAVLTAYRNTIQNLKTGNLDAYYSIISPESKLRIDKTLIPSGEDGVAYYTKFKSSFSTVIKAIDVGPVYILLAQPASSRKIKSAEMIYFSKDKPLVWYNEQFEFYLDDLFRTKEFQNVFFPLEPE